MNNALFELFKDEIIEIANTRIDAFLGDKVNMMIREITQKTHLTMIQMIKEKCNYTTEQAMELLSVPQSERSLLNEMIRANEQNVTQRVTQKLTLAAIRNLKTKLNYTAELAMEVLSVPQSERGLYAKLAE